MNRTRVAKKNSWTPTVGRRLRRRTERWHGDYWAWLSYSPVPGRLLAVSKLRRKAGTR